MSIFRVGHSDIECICPLSISQVRVRTGIHILAGVCYDASAREFFHFNWFNRRKTRRATSHPPQSTTVTRRQIQPLEIPTTLKPPLSPAPHSLFNPPTHPLSTLCQFLDRIYTSTTPPTNTQMLPTICRKAIQISCGARTRDIIYGNIYTQSWKLKCCAQQRFTKVGRRKPSPSLPIVHCLRRARSGNPFIVLIRAFGPTLPSAYITSTHCLEIRLFLSPLLHNLDKKISFYAWFSFIFSIFILSFSRKNPQFAIFMKNIIFISPVLLYTQKIRLVKIITLV